MQANIALKSGIYAIVHKDSGKQYIGSSKDMPRRLLGHKALLKRQSHPNSHLQAAWDINGESAFTFKPLMVCSHDDRIFYEQIIMDVYQVTNNDFGYNMSLKASHPQHSEETCKKISDAVTLAREAGKLVGNHKPHTQESKDKMSIARKGKPFLARRGIKHSEETKKKISTAKMGKVSWNKGIPMNESSKKKMIQAKENNFADPVFLEKWNAKKITHCKKGHAFSGDNIRFEKDGSRVCKTCSRDRVEKHRSIHPRRSGT